MRLRRKKTYVKKWSKVVEAAYKSWTSGCGFLRYVCKKHGHHSVEYKLARSRTLLMESRYCRAQARLLMELKNAKHKGT